MDCYDYATVSLLRFSRHQGCVLLAEFAAWMYAQKHLAYSTIKNYLWGASSYVQELEGLECHQGALLRKCLRAIRKASNYKPRRKKALTPAFIRALKKGLDFSNPRHVELFAAISLAFHGLLRNSEYTRKRIQDGSYKPTLLAGDVTMILLEGHKNTFRGRQRRALKVEIRASKNDIFGTGSTVIVPETGTDICPVAAYVGSRRARPDPLPEDPAFTHDGKNALRYTDVSRAIKRAAKQCGLREEDVGTHSLRSGGASCLAECGVSDAVIKAYGRWSSDCYLIYIRSRNVMSAAIATAISLYESSSLTFDQTYQFELSKEDEQEILKDVSLLKFQ